ncbi:MAG: gfo/Idh/MocA family oxidoreductase, partial [Pirellulaceae bacterium]|nr:gfo/Idh/MocA family oxidoreductase [Pirellulaceae bacterium]
HPEGFLEAFANVYRDSFDDMIARATGISMDNRNSVYPSANDGVEGVTFIHQCVASSEENGAWKPLAFGEIH